MSSTAWQPWAAGAAAGSTMTLIGHPFDTLKTRMQTNNAYASTWACARQTVAAEGLLAVYKGLGPALATTCLTSGLRFGVQVREISARKISAQCSANRRRDAAICTLQPKIRRSRREVEEFATWSGSRRCCSPRTFRREFGRHLRRHLDCALQLSAALAGETIGIYDGESFTVGARATRAARARRRMLALVRHE